jgi:bacterial/archaeal transporter family-2 protein
MGYWLLILIGLLGGIAVGLQAPIGGAMGQKIGGAASSFIIHLGGMIFSATLLYARGGEGIRDWHTLPWYMLIAGVFGLILFLTVSVTLPRLGSAMMITLIIIGQLSVGVILDHFGLLGVTARQIDLPRVIGILALFIGGYLIAR